MSPDHDNTRQMPIRGNDPLSAFRQKLFHDSRILFAPGKAANAGGVAVSGLEMSQNAMHLSWTAEEVDSRLKHIMESIHSECVRHGRCSDGYIDYAKGANIAAFMKVADAMCAQGY